MYTSGDRVSNMPFRSKEFLDFTRAWGIKATTSSPTFSQSDGHAVRFVQTLKRMFAKAQVVRRDSYLALLDYRNSPISGLSYSPAQMLMTRRLRSKVPAPLSSLCHRLWMLIRRYAKDNNAKSSTTTAEPSLCYL